jgi:tRNA-modifying protein YgfZ
MNTTAYSVPPATPSAEFDAVLTHGACVTLAQFGLIEANGEDAATFLHNQLTNDVEHLDAASAALAGYCSPKGRLLASFLVWRAGQDVRLLASRDLLPAVVKRLSMFVLRAKAKLAVSESMTLIGFAGEVRDTLSTLFDALPDGALSVVDGPAGTLIRLSDAVGRPRYLWCAPVAAAAAFLEAKRLPQVSEAVWDWLSVRSGEAWITPPTVEQFVPQMVNYDAIGAVNFRKGCYPGQEIVARSQYRGTIKRRTALAHLDSDVDSLRAGGEIFHSGDPGQPCGMIVNAASAPAGGVDVLVEIKLAALEGGTVHAGAPDGPVLHFEALPYALPSEV